MSDVNVHLDRQRGWGPTDERMYFARSFCTTSGNFFDLQTCHTDPALLIHSTASGYKTDHQQRLHCSHPQHNLLSMHTNDYPNSLFVRCKNTFGHRNVRKYFTRI